MGRNKYHHYKQKRKYSLGMNIFLIILALAFIKAFWFILLPVGLVAGYVYKRKEIHRLFYRADIKNVQGLVASIRSGVATYQELLAKKLTEQKLNSFRKQLLAQLAELDYLYQKVETYLDAYESKEVVDTLQLKYQLTISESQEEPVVAEDHSILQEQTRISQIAPEILETYCNVKRDDQVIQEKLANLTDKKEELTAIHETNMKRFNDILQGYLKIKAAPKDFFNAEERLQQAKQAMENFDQDLDLTIRQFNETDMQDFEISLRMMKKEEE